MPGGRAFLELLARNKRLRRERIAELLQAARTELGLTQIEVAWLFGWNQSDVSKMETGDLLPTIIELENFAVMCGKPLTYFATWSAQYDEDRAKQSLGLPADGFQRRLAVVQRRKRSRLHYGKRRQKTPPPTEPGRQRDAYVWAMTQQAKKRRKKKY